MTECYFSVLSFELPTNSQGFLIKIPLYDRYHIRRRYTKYFIIRMFLCSWLYLGLSNDLNKKYDTKMQIHVHVIAFYRIYPHLILKAVHYDVRSKELKDIWHGIAVGCNMLTVYFHINLYSFYI